MAGGSVGGGGSPGGAAGAGLASGASVVLASPVGTKLKAMVFASSDQTFDLVIQLRDVTNSSWRSVKKVSSSTVAAAGGTWTNGAVMAEDLPSMAQVLLVNTSVSTSNYAVDVNVVTNTTLAGS